MTSVIVTHRLMHFAKGTATQHHTYDGLTYHISLHMHVHRNADCSAFCETSKAPTRILYVCHECKEIRVSTTFGLKFYSSA